MAKRFCKMFSESFAVVLQFLYCPGEHQELSENWLQNLLPVVADVVKVVKVPYEPSIRFQRRG